MIKPRPVKSWKRSCGDSRSTPWPSRRSKCYSESIHVMSVALQYLRATSVALLVFLAPVLLLAQPSKPGTPARDPALLAAQSLYEQGQLAEAKAATQQF